MSKEHSITIVGAGLVGSLWAVMLRQRGFEVSIYEKRSDPRGTIIEQGRSINLVITSRGLHALKKAGLLDEILAITIPVFGRMIHPIRGENTYQAYGRANECNYSVSRFNLNNHMINAAEKAGAKIFFDHKLESIDFTERQLKFSEKPLSVKYELLFGADGAGSQVRHEMVKHLNNSNLEKIDWLEADYKELLMSADSTGRHKLEKNALHIWPRGSHMLMGLANQDGTFTLTLYLPKKGQVSFQNVQTDVQIRELFESQFPDVPALLSQTYVKEFSQNPQGSLGTVYCKRWVVNDSAALIGDAAHAIIPFFGQGMNCGFEDCTTLLGLLDSNDGNWPRALEKFDSTRHTDTNAIAAMALENFLEMRDKVGDPQFLLRKKTEVWLEEQFPEAYKSRYGMITYTLIPYGVAQQAGLIQNGLLQSLDELSKEKAKKLLEEQLIPFLKKNNLSLENFKIQTE